MKKSVISIVLLLVLLIAGLLGYFYFFPRSAQNILVPDIEQLEKLTIKTKGDTAMMDLQFRISNKGPFKFNIDSLEYHINFDTLRILSRQQDLDIVLKPGETDTLHLPVALPYKRLFTRIKQLQERDSADITTEVRVVYSTIFGKKSFPHKKTKRIGMPRPPKIEVEWVRYKRIKKGLVLLEARLKMQNPGEIELEVSDFNFDLRIADLLSAKGQDKGPFKVKPHSVLTRDIPVQVKIDRPLRTAWLLLVNKDKVPYNIVLRGSVRGKEEGSERTQVEIRNNGMAELMK